MQGHQSQLSSSASAWQAGQREQPEGAVLHGQWPACSRGATVNGTTLIEERLLITFLGRMA